MDENLNMLPTEEFIEIPAEEVVVTEPAIEDVDNSPEVDEAIEEVEASETEIINVEIDEIIGWSGADGKTHSGLPDRHGANQHLITSITGLREELDKIEKLKTVYSDKVGFANYYKWEGNKTYDTYGYFVSLTSDEFAIKICEGSDILGVSVRSAGFVGGGVSINDTDFIGDQGTMARDNYYGLIATSGLVEVRCELDVKIGDCVVSNKFGYAKKSDSEYGYKVLDTDIKDGTQYAIILLGVQADMTNALGAEILNIDDRVNAVESNIISAVNIANQAYSKATEIGVSNKEMSDKVDSALGAVDKVVSDVEDLSTQVSNSALISAQAKAIAESAATSAESAKIEAIAKSNEALAETAELRKEYKQQIAEIDTELDNTALELQATNERIETARDELQGNINGISSELDNTKTDLNNTRNELSSDIDDILSSLSDTDKTIASIATRVDENETSIDSLTVWKDTTSVTITDIEQKTDENSGSISILTAWKSDVEDDVKSIASIKTQSDANKSSIESLTSWQGTATESLASVKQQSDANKASIDSITSWQGKTDESIAQVKQQADNNEASIKSLTEWKGTTSESISSIEQRVDGAESSISSLTSWQGDAKTSIANVEQKSNENESKINSLTSWQGEASESIANVEQKATANESAITSLTAWKGEATESIATVKQTADKNSADISLIATWKSDVEDDVSSIASIKTTADENKAAISELVKKDTELSTTIAGVKTTADTNKASIEELVSWQSKVDPTINSVAGIKQTADGNAAKIEGLTTWQGTTNTAMARIEQKADANGAYIQSTVSNMDKYSVGPHSQAYGFTLEQAASVLEEGMIYVPTESVTETYAYGENQTYERTFTPQYLYMWGKIDGQYRWITVDKNYDETNETNTSSKAVYFTTTEPAVSGNFGYWYVNGDTTSGYEPYTLYKWSAYTTKDENGTDITESCWVPVATLAGNSSNRAVSQVRQDANSIESSVTTLDNKYAGTKTWVDDNKAAIQSTVEWKNTNAEAIATTIQRASDSEAYIAQIASVKNEDGTVNAAASIITAVNNDESSITLDADHINFEADGFTVNANKIDFTGSDFSIDSERIDFTGDTTFLRPSDLGDSGTTTISGNRITTGTIDASNVTITNLDASKITTGTLTVKNTSGYTLLSAGGNAVKVGDFSVKRTSTKSYLQSGKTSYSDSSNGVYLGTDGIGLGAGKFYVSDEGYLHASSGELQNLSITGKLSLNTDGTYYLTGNGSEYLKLPGMTVDEDDGFVCDRGAIGGFKADGTKLTCGNKDYLFPPLYTDTWLQAETGLCLYSGSTSDEKNTSSVGGLSISTYNTNTGIHYEQYMYAGRHDIFGESTTGKNVGLNLGAGRIMFRYAANTNLQPDDDETGNCGRIETGVIDSTFGSQVEGVSVYGKWYFNDNIFLNQTVYIPNQIIYQGKTFSDWLKEVDNALGLNWGWQ